MTILLEISTEGTVYCSCGTCLIMWNMSLMHSPEQTQKINNQIDIILNCLYVIKQGNSAMDLKSGSTIIGKPEMPPTM